MASDLSGSKPVSRRILYVIPSLVILLALGLSGAWIWASRQAAQAMDQWVAREHDAGRDWTCANRAIRGYPFRIELECGALEYKAKNGPLAAAAAGHVLAVWQIYQPSLIIVEFDRAIRLTQRSGRIYDLKSQSLRMSLHFDGLDLPDRLALVGERIEIPALLSAQSAEIHVLRGGDNTDPSDLRLYIESQSTVIAGMTRPDTQPLMIAADLRASHGGVLYSHAAGAVLDRWRAADGKLYVNGVKVTRGQGELQMKGQLALDDTHRLNGKLDLKTDGFSDLLDATGIKAGGFSLNAKAMSLPLTFDRGHVLIGPLKIGDIPPLY